MRAASTDSGSSYTTDSHSFTRSSRSGITQKSEWTKTDLDKQETFEEESNDDSMLNKLEKNTRLMKMTSTEANAESISRTGSHGPHTPSRNLEQLESKKSNLGEVEKKDAEKVAVASGNMSVGTLSTTGSDSDSSKTQEKPALCNNILYNRINFKKKFRIMKNFSSQ